MDPNTEIAIIVTYILGLLGGILLAQWMGRGQPYVLPRLPIQTTKMLITYAYDQTASDDEQEDEQEQQQQQDQDQEDAESGSDEERPGKQSPPPDSEFTMTENPMLRQRVVSQSTGVVETTTLCSEPTESQFKPIEQSLCSTDS